MSDANPIVPASAVMPALHGGGHASPQLADLRRRARRGICIESGGALALVLGAFALVSYQLDRHLRLEWPFRLVLLLGLLAVVVRIVRDRLLRPLAVQLDDDEMALAVERRAPDVRQALISSLQFERVLGSGAVVVESRALMTAVVEDVRGRLAAIPFGAALDAARVQKFGGLLAVVLAAFVAWGGLDGRSLGLWAARNLGLSNIEWPRYTTLRFLDDGDVVRMPQGDSRTVRVSADGPIPDQVFVYFRFQGGEQGVEPMSSTGEREFSWTLQSVLENVTLHCEGGDGLSRDLRIEVVERPRIDHVKVELVFPPYMDKEPETLPATEGEIRLPRGGHLRLAGRCDKKTITDAFLLFGNDKKIALTRDADGHAFSGQLEPEATGLLVLDVIDTDQLGAGQPPKWLVRLADDRPPTVDFKLRGISSLISSRARIPGDLKVKDDFGVRAVAAGIRVAEDNAADPSKSQPKEPPKDPTAQGQPAPPTPAAAAPFEPVEVLYGTELPKNTVRYETTASVDLVQVCPELDEKSPNNRVRPGMLLSLRFSAKDNFGPGDPHESFGETITFRVVTREKLSEELRRRQVEQRQELQHIYEEEKTARLEVKEKFSPAAASDKAPLARQQLKALSRLQTALGRRVAFVGESYQKILWEFENNRLMEPANVRQLEAIIPQPLAALAKDDFPATTRQVDDFANTGKEETRSQAVAGYEQIEQRIQAVLKVMEDAETLAALLEMLRGVIKQEDSAIHDVEKRLRELEDKLLHPDRDKKPSDPQPPAIDQPKKK